MMTWTQDELDKIGDTEEIQITSLRRDGSLRKPVTIWIVRLGSDLYVRSVMGREGAWYRGTQVRREGRIQANGIQKDVAFEDVTDPAAIAQVDAAYQTKYRRYPTDLAPMLKPESRVTTLRLIPR